MDGRTSRRDTCIVGCPGCTCCVHTSRHIQAPIAGPSAPRCRTLRLETIQVPDICEATRACLEKAPTQWKAAVRQALASARTQDVSRLRPRLLEAGLFSSFSSNLPRCACCSVASGLQFFVETDRNFTAPAGCHQRVRLAGIVQCEPMRNQVCRMQVPAHQHLN